MTVAAKDLRMSAPMKRPTVRTSVVAATVIGNAIEFFDFVSYSYFAVYIGRAFFPLSGPGMSLLASVAVFGVGFFSRPLGGVLIGAFADRAGRKPALILTVLLITIGTIGLAATPRYARIGMAAPVIVILCRLLQGFALGGEVGPASAFLIEIAPPDKRGLYASWQLASQGIAGLISGCVGTGLSLALSAEQLADWGWRLPFLLCLGLVPVALYLRRSMPETLDDAVAGPVNAPASRLADHGRTIVLAVLVVLGATVMAYVISYMTTYAIATLHLPPSVGLAAPFVGGVAYMTFSLLGGWLSDRVGRKLVMLVPRVILALGTLPAFYWLAAAPSAMAVWVTTFVLSAVTSMSAAAGVTMIPELLPRSVRARGLGLAYALGVSLFGGTTQFILTGLIQVTGDKTSPAWYVMVTGLISAVAILMLPESRGRDIHQG